MAVAGHPLAPPPLPPFFGNMDSPPPPPRSPFDYSTSMLVIGALLAVVIAVSAAIHLALRLLSRRRSPPPPTSIIHARLPGSSSASSSMAPPDPSSDPHQKALIDSLPLLIVDNATALPNPSSPADCAVCLSPFRPGDGLRLLPACGHAFHAPCIDAWIIRSTPSCPLCRRPIVAPSRSGSFSVEIGALSRRRSSGDSSDIVAAAPPARQGRMWRSSSYSLGSSSFDYLAAEEETAAAAAEVRRVLPEKDAAGTADSAPPPGEAAGAGSSRSWLREYIERLTSSSPFSSFRLSSRRFDAAAAPVSSAAVDAAGGFARNSWDLEENQPRPAPAPVGEEEEVAGGNFYTSLGRWLLGVSS